MAPPLKVQECKPINLCDVKEFLHAKPAHFFLSIVCISVENHGACCSTLSQSATKESHKDRQRGIFVDGKRPALFDTGIYRVYIYIYPLDFSHRYQNEQNDAIFEAGDTFSYLIYVCISNFRGRKILSYYKLELVINLPVKVGCFQKYRIDVQLSQPLTAYHEFFMNLTRILKILVNSFLICYHLW